MQHINILDFFLLSFISFFILFLWVFVATLIQHIKDKKPLTNI